MFKRLAQYENQTQRDMVPGKDSARKQSGSYNAPDTCTAKPELRWPNEEHVSTGQRQKPAYDDLSLAQWASCQLRTILLI